MSKVSRNKPSRQPGTVMSSVKGHHCFRYQYDQNGTALLQFTTNNLLALLVNLDTAVTSGTLGAQTLIFDAVRLRRVRAWICGPAAGFTHASLDWTTENAFLGSDGMNTTASQVGSAEALHLDKKPPKNSFSNLWFNQSQTSYTLFTLNCTNNTGNIQVVLDLDVDFVLLDKYTTSPVQLSLRSTQAWATATGQLLFTYADNQAGTPHWTPVGCSNVY
jgi:hypothetical protein